MLTHFARNAAPMCGSPAGLVLERMSTNPHDANCVECLWLVAAELLGNGSAILEKIRALTKVVVS